MLPGRVLGRAGHAAPKPRKKTPPIKDEDRQRYFKDGSALSFHEIRKRANHYFTTRAGDRRKSERRERE